MGLTKTGHYLFEKRGYYYFSRRVPSDLKQSYRTSRIVLSLKTKSVHVAQSRAKSLGTKLEEEWQTLRLLNNQSVLSKYLITRSQVTGSPSTAPVLSKALEIYLDAKSEGKTKTFWQSAQRCIKFALDLLGDRPIDSYVRSEVNEIRDAYFKAGLKLASIKRNLSSLRAIVNFAAKESGIDEPSAFSGIYLGEQDVMSKTKRPAFPLESIRTIQEECTLVDDQARWLIALVSDTGMRLIEAAGLITDDVVLSEDIPYVLVRRHPWRRLKTTGSERKIPLYGAALWAIQRATANATSKFLFSRYCNEETCKANSASAALNKWIGSRAPEGCVVHSFRHSMRDRLRAVECPPDIIDRIGGWSIAGVGESYGQGYPLEVLAKWMKNAVTK